MQIKGKILLRLQLSLTGCKGHGLHISWDLLVMTVRIRCIEGVVERQVEICLDLLLLRLNSTTLWLRLLRHLTYLFQRALCISTRRNSGYLFLLCEFEFLLNIGDTLISHSE